MRTGRRLLGLRACFSITWALTGTCAALLAAGGAALAASVSDRSRVPVGPLDTPVPGREERVRHVMRRLDLTPGEKLVYDVRWSGLPAGRATLSVKWKRDFEGKPAYHIESEVRSNAFVSVIYPVKDKVITIIDEAGGFSRLFEMSKNEKDIKQNEHIRFDYERNLALYEKRKPGPFPRRTRHRVRIDGWLQDPLSCLYYLRGVDLAPGSRVQMPVHTARKSWVLVVEALRREKIKLPKLGTVTALRLEPAMRFQGIFVRKGRMVVWVDEETRVPVLMRVDIPLGSVAVTLASAENSPLKFAADGAGPAGPDEAPAGEALPRDATSAEGDSPSVGPEPVHREAPPPERPAAVHREAPAAGDTPASVGSGAGE